MKNLVAASIPITLALLASPVLANGWKARVQSDYPPKALLEGREGTTYVTVTVGTDGMAKDCVVTKSSGSDDLDKASCDQMLKYARFKPQTDDKGNPQEGTFSTKFNWRLH